MNDKDATLREMRWERGWRHRRWQWRRRQRRRRQRRRRQRRRWRRWRRRWWRTGNGARGHRFLSIAGQLEKIDPADLPSSTQLGAANGQTTPAAAMGTTFQKRKEIIKPPSFIFSVVIKHDSLPFKPSALNGTTTIISDKTAAATATTATTATTTTQ